MPSCEGAEALGSCWHLGGKGEACSSVCGAVELVDGTATEALASSEPVVQRTPTPPAPLHLTPAATATATSISNSTSPPNPPPPPPL